MDRRSDLVRAAKRLMQERPPSHITGREIAERADASYGLIAYHWHSLDRLFVEAFLTARTEFLDTLTSDPATWLDGPADWLRIMANVHNDPAFRKAWAEHGEPDRRARQLLSGMIHSDDTGDLTARWVIYVRLRASLEMRSEPSSFGVYADSARALNDRDRIRYEARIESHTRRLILELIAPEATTRRR